MELEEVGVNTASALHLSREQTDRALGVVVGMACGDALGAGYEFGPPLSPLQPIEMKGGGGFGWAPGEWTDDTSMAIPLLEALARNDDLERPEALQWLLSRWRDWAGGAKDVGLQISQVLFSLEECSEAEALTAGRALHQREGQSAGNGSLMRTAPLALASLSTDGAARLLRIARRVSDLTHHESDAGDACVLWCLAIRHAILTGSFDVAFGLRALPAEAARSWQKRLLKAEQSEPRNFRRNGWVVQALQGAWSALVRATSFREAVEGAVRGGGDADTVAAIAGALAGARWGLSGIPLEWQAKIHGWPGLRCADLVELSRQALPLQGTNEPG